MNIVISVLSFALLTLSLIVLRRVLAQLDRLEAAQAKSVEEQVEMRINRLADFIDEARIRE